MEHLKTELKTKKIGSPANSMATLSYPQKSLGCGLAQLRDEPSFDRNTFIKGVNQRSNILWTALHKVPTRVIFPQHFASLLTKWFWNTVSFQNPKQFLSGGFIRNKLLPQLNLITRHDLLLFAR
jgi:hypothetical protein